uniref:ArfGAP with dual PH domains 1 n=1 Tax=Cercocebus atys TaxID=9531 RepID=A0A2K5L133_CERAT
MVLSSPCRLLREQWIRAKYERQEFIYPEKQEPYSAGYREGFLWKRGRDNGQFLSRKFVLTEREGALKYFNRNDAKEPKAVMKIEHLNATFQPAKIGHPHGLQVTYLKDNSTRNIFIYHEDGKEIVDWFNALRAARFHYLQVAFPGASDADLVPKLSRNYLKEGYMEKTGPKQTEGFRKRWFTMDDRRLMYFKDPLDAFARGEVFIGSKESGYTVLHGFPPSTQGHHWPHGITIVTPDRKFLFACETESDQREWVAAFQKAVDRPMLPQEYAGEGGGRPAAWTGSQFPAAVTAPDPVPLQWRHTSSINPSECGQRPTDTGLTVADGGDLWMGGCSVLMPPGPTCSSGQPGRCQVGPEPLGPCASLEPQGRQPRP